MKILICGLLKYPDGDAGSIRQRMFAKALIALGCEVSIVGIGPFEKKPIIAKSGETYYSLREPQNNKLGKIKTYLCYWKRLKQIICNLRPDVIIMDDIGPLRNVKLLNLCKRNGIKLVHDSVEWYSPEQFKRGKWASSYIRKDITNRFLIRKPINVIAISTYLEDYFSKKGLTCTRIPIMISDEDLSREKSTKADIVTFTYAGQPGKKDYLHVMIEAFSMLTPDEQSHVRFNIIGCTREQVLETNMNVKMLENIGEILTFWGRISHKDVLRILEQTDFTILMRASEQRYAKAGFPTKVVESLSRSTPIICNLSSDLGLYLTDGVDSLIVDTCSADELRNCIVEAIRMPELQRKKMAENAYRTAQDKFHYTSYLGNLKQVIS